MSIENNRHDEAVDKVLAALRDAVPPEGIQARIALRLQQHPQPAPAPRWRDRLAAGTLAGAWWRGAISGAVTAMLLITLVLLAGHLLRQHTPEGGQIAVAGGSAVAPAVTPSASPHVTPVDQGRARPCAIPAVLPVHSVSPAPSEQKLLAESRAESTSPSHPAPEPALTAQERGLVRLVRTADPKELATLNAETQAKLQAKDEADFNKFFAPPTPPPTIQNNE
jgi:hypothetical protein